MSSYSSRDRGRYNDDDAVHRNGSRPHPHRSHSNSFRSAPYPVPAERERKDPTKLDKWANDLFRPNSQGHAPTINREAIKARHDSVASHLRPRDSYTSTSSYGSVQPGLSNVDLAVRMNLAPRPASAPASSAASDHSAVAAERAARRTEREKAEKARRDELARKREIEKNAQAQRRRDEKQTAIATEEDKGFVVQVEGLVWGTSADDVQTAFGNYGEITFCFIVNEEATSDNPEPDLVARMTYQTYANAAEACAQLNGAIADGKTLKVTQVPRTPYPTPSHSVIGAAASSRAASSAPAPVVATKAPEPVRRPVGPPSRMVADQFDGGVVPLAPEVAEVASQAYQDDFDEDVPMGMDVDDSTAATASTHASTDQNRGAGQRGGRGRGRGGRGGGSSRSGNFHAPPSAPKAGVSLMDRLKIPANAASSSNNHGNANGRNGSQAGRGRGGLASLMSRIAQ